MSSAARTLVLALGNELAGDDAVALHAARQMRAYCGPDVDIIETGEAGLALLDFITGYTRLLILDSVCGLPQAAGTIQTYRLSDLRAIQAPSPHYAGIPEMKRIAEVCELGFPEDVCAVAMAIEQPDQICSSLSPTVQESLPCMIQRALAVLRSWDHECLDPTE